MSSTLARLLARAGETLSPGERVWLSPGLSSFREALQRDGKALVGATDDAPVALAIASWEELATDLPLPPAERIVGVGLQMGRSTLRAIERAQTRGLPALQLVSEEATLEVRDIGVVVTSLVDGLSARDLQTRLRIPLLAGPDLSGRPAQGD